MLLETSRPTKRVISVIYDVIALSLSLYIAWALRLGSFEVHTTPADWVCLSVTILVSIIAFIKLGLYRAILRYLAPDAILSILLGILISSLTLAACSFFFNSGIPRSVPINFLLIAVILVGLPRLLVRNVVQMFFPIGDTKVIIYGAGSAGRMLADSLRQSKEFQPVAFLDDDLRLSNTRIKGLPVFPGNKTEFLLEKYRCKNIFLALGAVKRSNRLRIIRSLEKFSVQIQTIPPLEDLTRGQANISEIRDIEIEDLLGRDPVQPDTELLRANIFNKVVMVTGAGGSIGSELCRQILEKKPISIILYELNEYNLYAIERELQALKVELKLKVDIVQLIGSVQNRQLLNAVMKNFRVDTVYHAAAYKHVPMIESNMIEGVKNNVLGTHNCALCAAESGVSTFVLISTDKAVRSTNIMGASKRLAEMAIKALSQDKNITTTFCAVRFGNVLGSSGSVVPLFKQQIEKGGPLTVTHPEVTRYFMTIPEAAQLVIQAGALSNGGETYVLEMGEPVKIVDLAMEMILLSGLTINDKNNPNGDIAIEFTGLRPGEKLYEELLISDNIVGTTHPRITEALETPVAAAQVNLLLNQLTKACENYDCKEVHRLIKTSPNVLYSGNDEINDSVMRQKSRTNTELTLVKN